MILKGDSRKRVPFCYFLKLVPDIGHLVLVERRRQEKSWKNVGMLAERSLNPVADVECRATECAGMTAPHGDPGKVHSMEVCGRDRAAVKPSSESQQASAAARGLCPGAGVGLAGRAAPQRTCTALTTETDHQ